MIIIKTEKLTDEAILMVIKTIGLKKASQRCGKSIGFISDCVTGRRQLKFEDYCKIMNKKELTKGELLHMKFDGDFTNTTLRLELSKGRTLDVAHCECNVCKNEFFVPSSSKEYLPKFCPYCGLEFQYGKQFED